MKAINEVLCNELRTSFLDIDLPFEVVPHFSLEDEVTGTKIQIETTGIKIIGIRIQIEVNLSVKDEIFLPEDASPDLDLTDGQVQVGRCAIDVE